MRRLQAAILASVVCCLVLATMIRADSPSAAAKMQFWDTPRRGANGFNKSFDEQWFADLNATGIRFCRLAVGKAKGEGRDFLLGNADAFVGIPKSDLEQTLQLVRWAAKHEIDVLIVPLSLPGARWSQQNGGVVDKRLWSDFAYHDQSAAFWKELATALRDEPNIIGYEILNEPTPERALDKAADEWTSDLAALSAKYKGTPADVNELYARVIPSIREVDRDTPIVLSSSFYANAKMVLFLKPADDPNVVYTFHTYEPYAFTNRKTNDGRFSYPGKVLTGDAEMNWDRAQIDRYVQPVADWAKANHVPANRILVGEFGCDRRVPGAQSYLSDSIAVFDAHGWHWAFYGFREDEWDALDYELGTKPLPWGYWQALERGEKPSLPRKENPLWRTLIDATTRPAEK